MKSLFMISGTMGIGKTSVCRQLRQDLKNCVFLDGDWCWDANPFQVTDETKRMVIENICTDGKTVAEIAREILAR